MNVIISSEAYAQKLIKTVQDQGCCYDLLPEKVGLRVKVNYIVDGDRIGWCEGSRTFNIPDCGQKSEFVTAIVRDMRRLLIRQEHPFVFQYSQINP